jgi:enoyl-CoA hydratase/carnithine racemase
MGRGRALEVMLSAQDYDAELAERYGWINRALPAGAIGDFVRSLAHRIAGFPAAGRVALKDRINAIALAPPDDFRRDSDLFLECARSPEAQSRTQTAMKRGYPGRRHKRTGRGPGYRRSRFSMSDARCRASWKASAAGDLSQWDSSLLA